MSEAVMRISARRMDFYDRQVIGRIIDKYGLSEREAISLFIKSKTYQSLLDSRTAIDTMSPLIIFELWESEQVTGDPMRSRYMRV